MRQDAVGRGFTLSARKRIYSRAKCFGYTRGVKPGLLTQAAVFPRQQADLEIPEAPPVPVRAI
jgi:hypothetical protein